MLEAVFRGHGTFIALAILIMIAVWVATFRSSSQPARGALVTATWAASIAGVLALTLWSTGESRGPGECVIDLDLRDSFNTEQGLLNLAMFIPPGILGVLATRRFLPAAAVGVTLTIAVETLQGAFPILGRACDTGDLIANSCGALAGAVVGWGLVKLDTDRATSWQFRRRPALLSAVSVAACIGVLWATCITPRTIVTATTVRTASPAQQQVLRKELLRAFGNSYTAEAITFARSDSGAGNLSASIGPDSSMNLSWPDTVSAEYSLEVNTQGPDHGYRVPGAPARATSAGQALNIAMMYARSHTAWALPGVHPTATPVPHVGWMISWRRYAHAVLMPMRLDIEIDHAGRVRRLLSRHLSDVTVAPPILTAARAALAAQHFGPHCTKAVPGELLAMRSGDRWIAAWRVAVTCRTRRGVITIDSRKGNVVSTSLFPRIAEPGPDR